MRNTVTNNPLFASFFALLFAATMALGGCSSDTLTGPAQPSANGPAAVNSPAANAPHNTGISARTNGSGGSTTAEDSHNLGGDDD